MLPSETLPVCTFRVTFRSHQAQHGRSEPRLVETVTWLDWLRLLRRIAENTPKADAGTMVGHVFSRLQRYSGAEEQLWWPRRLLGFHQVLKVHISAPETLTLLGHLWRFFTMPRKSDFDSRVLASAVVPQPGMSPRSHWQVTLTGFDRCLI